jgi:hypothetical protein
MKNHTLLLIVEVQEVDDRWLFGIEKTVLLKVQPIAICLYIMLECIMSHKFLWIFGKVIERVCE